MPVLLRHFGLGQLSAKTARRTVQGCRRGHDSVQSVLPESKLSASHQASFMQIFWSQGLLELRHPRCNGVQTKSAPWAQRRKAPRKARCFPPNDCPLDSVFQGGVSVFRSMEAPEGQGGRHDQRLATAFQPVAPFCRCMRVGGKGHGEMPVVPCHRSSLRRAKRGEKSSRKRRPYQKGFRWNMSVPGLSNRKESGI